jgi:hypothetical protein
MINIKTLPYKADSPEKTPELSESSFLYMQLMKARGGWGGGGGRIMLKVFIIVFRTFKKYSVFDMIP